MSKYVKSLNWQLHEICSILLYLQKHIMISLPALQCLLLLFCQINGILRVILSYTTCADMMCYQAALDCLCPFSEMSPYSIHDGLSLCLPSFLLLSLPRFSRSLLNILPNGLKGLLIASQAYYVSFYSLSHLSNSGDGASSFRQLSALNSLCKNVKQMLYKCW